MSNEAPPTSRKTLWLVAAVCIAPLDLAVSKISRFSEQDQADIHSLADAGLIAHDKLRAHALEALDYYVGNTAWVRGTIDIICSEIS
jgi:hypothetical protein